jgi:hypothetical protein
VHVVAARLGDRPETILQSYAHLLPQSDEHAARALADALVSMRPETPVLSGRTL